MEQAAQLNAVSKMAAKAMKESGAMNHSFVDLDKLKDVVANGDPR